ncbi:insulinase family protein [Actinoplanes sp. NEAU-A12]|uniref:Insulinase family protein n=1 Tax=Actinoplanes sandaracinus TaxID=3045177 RepID=A0ABT6WFH0_9ACTN|nr:insulinase family protein [Actinoplanes sandaracinus]MDI6098486.1 insulinase family protein [Actinoplanes sandaracinus]
MITRLEVDGVPAVLAPVSGPTHAGLVFRVGTADEPLPRRGITRLVQHLVTDGPGTTGPEHTYFHVQGSAAEITERLTGVCAALRDPPAGRLTAVRDRLLNTPPDRDPLPMWRYGARGFGVASYPEWALAGLTEEHLRYWIARYFTRENAALWVAGDAIPEGLRLDLPSGERQPAPAAVTALPATPAWFSGPGGGTAWDTVVRREARAAVFANVLERRMLHDLRRLDGISGQARTEYVPRSDGTARILAVADARPEEQEAVLGGMIDVLAAMRAGQIGPDEVAGVVELTCEGLRESESRGARLPGQAFNLLAGRDIPTLDEALDEVRAVTVEDVAGVASSAYDAGLLMTPRGSTAGWAGYTAAPVMSDTVLPGRAHRGRKDRGLRLISGDEGVSVTGAGLVATVRWDSCAALLAWPDGGRRLIGHDAVAARIEPTLYRDAGRVVAEVDARIPEHLRIEMPARDRDRIPQPEPPAREDGRQPLPVLLLFGVLALFFLGGGLWVVGRLLAGAAGPGGTLENTLVVASAVLFGGFFGRLALAGLRERRAAGTPPP